MNKGEQYELFPRTPEVVQPQAEGGLSLKCEGVADCSVLSTREGTVPFPAHRQVGLARKIARAIAGRSERLGKRYWQVECRRLIGRLEAQGFDRATIEVELQRFTIVVSDELARLAENEQRRPGGAA